MKTLDLSVLRESDKYWFESVDMTCPFCNGESELPNGDYCEHCENGYFEIYWDIAFNVPYLSDSRSFEQARKVAFERGWLLFEYNDEYYIAAGSCGYDFTWVRQSIILYLCGEIPADYAHDLSSGGYVFVSDSRKRTLIKATKHALYREIRRIHMDIDYLNRYTS